MNAAVFLDRDGTLIEEVGYLDRAERVALYPFAADAIRALNRAGIRIVMVTNQSGVARGFFTEAVVEDVPSPHRESARASAARTSTRTTIARTIRTAACRSTRSVASAASRDGPWWIEPCANWASIPQRSFTVGDRWLDVGLARTIGARGLLVRTGYGSDEEHRQPDGLSADAVVDNLVEAVSWILVNSR